MDEKKERTPVWFPFMSHHEWHGFNDYRELVDFLEDGILPSESGFVQAESRKDMLMLPKPKSRAARVRDRRRKFVEASNEANSNGSAIKPKDGDNVTKPIMRVRGGKITEITVPVKAIPVKVEEPKVIEQSVKIGPVIEGETVEAITEDIAYGGNGG